MCPQEEQEQDNKAKLRPAGKKYFLNQKKVSH
jgi:hypothetical protein